MQRLNVWKGSQYNNYNMLWATSPNAVPLFLVLLLVFFWGGGGGGELGDCDSYM